MSMAEQIETKLTRAFSPTRIAVYDDSHKHRGHAGARPEGETHFRVELVSPRFEGLGRVERQRLVYAELSAELADSVHALQLKVLAPGEDTAAGSGA